MARRVAVESTRSSRRLRLVHLEWRPALAEPEQCCQFVSLLRECSSFLWRLEVNSIQVSGRRGSSLWCLAAVGLPLVATSISLVHFISCSGRSRQWLVKLLQFSFRLAVWRPLNADHHHHNNRPCRAVVVTRKPSQGKQNSQFDPIYLPTWLLLCSTPLKCVEMIKHFRDSTTMMMINLHTQLERAPLVVVVLLQLLSGQKLVTCRDSN